MKCQHRGCNRTVVVDCFKPELLKSGTDFGYLDESTRERMINDSIEYYCPEHCEDHGYCWNCGAPMDNRVHHNSSSSGICSHCHEKL